MAQKPHPYSPDDRAAAERIQDWLEEGEAGRTKAALARAAGISTGTVSLVLSRQYPSSPTAHLEAMGAAIGREREREAVPEIPYTATSVARAVHQIIGRVHNDRDFGLFCGRVGVGKTVALRQYAREHPGVALLLEAYPGAGAPVVLRTLARALGGVPARRRTVADLTAALVEALGPGDRVILVDEAETLTDRALLHLRRISDAAGVGVVLVGTPALMSLIYDPDGKFGQITSRIGLWPPTCQSITEKDAAALTASYLGESPDAETQAAIWTACQGSARALRNLLRNSRRWCRKHRNELDAEVVRQVDRHAMGGRRQAA